MAFNITTDIPLFSERSPIIVASITGAPFDGGYHNYTFNLSSPFDYTDPEIWGDPTVSPYLGIDDQCYVYWLQYDDLTFEEIIFLDNVTWISTTQFTASTNISGTPLANTGLFYVNWIPTHSSTITEYNGTKYFLTGDLLGIRPWKQTGNDTFAPETIDVFSTYPNTDLTTSSIVGDLFGVTGGNPDRNLTNFTSPQRFGGFGKVDDNGLSWGWTRRTANGDVGALLSNNGMGVALSYLDYSDFSWSPEVLHNDNGPSIEGAFNGFTPGYFHNVFRQENGRAGTISQDGTKFFVIHDGQRERVPHTTGTNGVDAFFYSRVFLASWDVATSSWDYGNLVIAGTGLEEEYYFPVDIIEHNDRLYVLVSKDTSWSPTYSPDYFEKCSLYSMILDKNGNILKDLTLVTTNVIVYRSNRYRPGEMRITTFDGVESVQFACQVYRATFSGGSRIDYVAEFTAPIDTSTHSWTERVIIDYDDPDNFDKQIVFGRPFSQRLALFFAENAGTMYAFWGSSAEDSNPSTGEYRMHGSEIYYSTRSPSGSWSDPAAWRTGVNDGDWLYNNDGSENWNFSRLVPGAQHYSYPMPFVQNGQIYLFATKYNAWDLYIASDPSGSPSFRYHFWPHILATGESLYPWAYLY